MKKLALDVEQLKVDSYETTSESTRDRGTVWGHNSHTNTTRTYDFTCAGSTCGLKTNAASCYANETVVDDQNQNIVAPLYPEVDFGEMA